MKPAKEVISEFSIYMESNGRAAKTIYGYSSDLRRFQVFYEERYNMEWFPEETMTNDIEAFLQMLYVTEGLLAPSRNRILYCLRSFFRYTFGRGITIINPAAGVRSVKYRRKRAEFLTSDEVDTLVSIIDHVLIKVVTQTLWHTGLRISELIKLSVRDVDFSQPAIHVVGIEDADRDVPINPVLYEILMEYRKSLPEVLEPYESFFRLESTGHLSPSTYNRRLKEYVHRLGWEKKVTAHTFRHSFSSYLENHGTSPVVVKELLGHDGLDTTNIYMHAEPRKLVEAVNLLARPSREEL